MQTIYRPGQWYLIVVPGALVALPPDVDNDLVSRLWERLPAEKTLASVMDVLTTAAGGSFVALPPFAAAVVEGSAVRIALRGGVVARVSSAAGAAYELSGAEVTTWSERFVGDAARIEITVEETDAEAVLPVQSGIVRASAASAELEADDDAPIVAALGATPRIDRAESGASAAALAGGAAPVLALFGGPSSPSVDGTPDLPGAAAAAVAEQEPAAPDESSGSEHPSASEEPAVEEPAVEGPVVEVPAVEEPAAAEPDETNATDEPAAHEATDESAEDESVDDEPIEDEPAADESVDLPEETIVSAPAAPVAAVGSIPPPPAIPDLPGAPLLPPPPLPDDALPDETISGESAPEETIAGDTGSGGNGLDEHTWEPPQRSFAPQDDLDEIEQLFDETLQGGSEGAPVPEAPPVATVAPVPALGDHDGATITSAELEDLRRRQSASDDVATQVLAAVPANHGRIRVSSGQVVELDRTVIIGRRPRSTRASGHDLPHLVAVDSPQQDISRNHLEIRPDAGTVVVIDLRTTNGSTLVRPGAEPMRLHPGEQTLVLSGDVVDLGDGVTVLFEDIP